MKEITDTSSVMKADVVFEYDEPMIMYKGGYYPHCGNCGQAIHHHKQKYCDKCLLELCWGSMFYRDKRYEKLRNRLIWVVGSMLLWAFSYCFIKGV